MQILPSTNNTIIRILSKYIFLLSIFLFPHCFEYEEKIILNSNLSGKVILDYVIPVDRKSGTSLISFFPESEQKFKDRYNFVEVLSFTEENTKPLVQNLNYKRIIVEFLFNNISDLENILIGENTISIIGNKILIQRKLKVPKYKKLDNKFYNYFYKIIYNSYKGRNLKFSLNAPNYFDVISNLGTLPVPGIMNYQITLDRILETNNEIIWNISIKINPSP